MYLRNNTSEKVDLRYRTHVLVVVFLVVIVVVGKFLILYFVLSVSYNFVECIKHKQNISHFESL